MKYFKLILLVTILTSVVISHFAQSISEDKRLYRDDDNATSQPASLRGVSRFLSHRVRYRFKTCNKYAKICRGRSSPGPDCCKKRCVDVSQDRLNCGKCGHKCKFSAICCKGKCINPLKHNKHCGGCGNNCSILGSKCAYGLCSYA